MGDMKWFESYENRQELAAHLITVGVLTTPRSVLRFYEKPWKYTPEWEDFTSEHFVPDYTCGKCGGEGTVDTDMSVQNAHLYIIQCPDCGGTGLDAPWEESVGLENPDDWAPSDVLMREGEREPSYTELQDDPHFWERTP